MSGACKYINRRIFIVYTHISGSMYCLYVYIEPEECYNCDRGNKEVKAQSNTGMYVHIDNIPGVTIHDTNSDTPVII